MRVKHMKELDKIMLRGMRFYGRHGVYPAEKAQGQWFEVDADICGDFAVAARTDNIENALDYSQVYEAVKKIVEGPGVNLVENLAQQIAQVLLALPLAKMVRVTVKKPEAPLAGPLLYAGVEIVRWKNEC